ncbi:pyridoxal phosphate-dependent aminotransferase [Pseudooceanicola sp. CBS1P-1]|uniref:cysteine-S-conjugate beta-lyase n=1 Tax=Pseudooceanicola albus TaxID=2692189 RepID=A0A6L7G1V8_9RHOB|nr:MULTISPECIES: MalY/PatB family protein [Pseudooceanicola]MBT9384035.1 pyridoxal phosphate-dependent aminotransferase [Pseudooceanicola endophyticus]MXN16553.1 putative C-S lyase [Pseudooceanicola albus]
MNFDEIIDRRGTHSSKWDMMEKLYGLSPEDGLPMWVADMDFRPPHSVQQALEAYAAEGVFGYFGDERDYLASVCWWSETRHGWTIDPEWIFSTHGLVNGTGLCVEAFTAPGDGVVLFTPVYHAFARTIKAAGRRVVECPLIQVDGRYEMDFDAYDTLLDGSEKMVILCSPHNPGGRVWSKAELQQVADFARRHDLILVSDEIHCDITMPGHTHVPMALADEGISERLVMMTAATKTFNLAGIHTGNVIIPDPALRKRFGQLMAGLGISPNAFAQRLVPAAYAPEGAAWVDALCDYLDGNRHLFDSGINAIPGLRSMRLEGTYLAWVDFSGTGMSTQEVQRRILDEAKIAVNFGSAFGAGGETFQRFNIGTQRERVVEAVERMQRAFADLQ